MNRTEITLVVDPQECFVTGALGTEEAQKIVSDIARAIENAAKKKKDFIFVTQDTHTVDYPSTREGRMLPVLHGIPGMDTGWAIAKPVWDALANVDVRVIRKGDFGSFDVKAIMLNRCGMRPESNGELLRIKICGFCTDVCVITMAIILRQQFPEAEIIVDPRLCAGVTPEKHKAALMVMESCQILVKEVYDI